MRTAEILLIGFALLSPASAETQAVSLNAPGVRKDLNVRSEVVQHKGREALRVADAAGANGKGDVNRIVVLEGTEFQNGIIEVDLAGEPRPDAVGQARGFVGIAFRAAPDVSRFECFYLRPTNGRADDQVRRNHSAQYVSFPDYPWQRLRKEAPEKYETYVDLVPSEWIKVKVDVTGNRARLYVHGAEQPSLLVHDLKLGEDAKGRIALWIGPGTVAHFANLRVTR